MFKGIGKIIQKEQFDPGLLSLFVNPYYFARKELIRNIRAFSNYIKGDVLDIGCGKKPYERLFSGVTSYIGLEICDAKNRTDKKIDILYDGRRFPFENNTFDSIVTFEVFEHVFNPDEFLKEVNRVLKINGVLLMSASFIWDEHEQPYDYARYSSFGLKSLLSKYGFEVIEHRKTVQGLRIIFQLINVYIYKIIAVKNIYLDLLFTIIFTSPFNILGEILSRFFPSNKDLYLDNIILAGKKKIYE